MCECVCLPSLNRDFYRSPSFIPLVSRSPPSLTCRWRIAAGELHKSTRLRLSNTPSHQTGGRSSYSQKHAFSPLPSPPQVPHLCLSDGEGGAVVKTLTIPPSTPLKGCVPAEAAVIEEAGSKRLLFRTISQRLGHHQGFDYNGAAEYSPRLLCSSFIFCSLNIPFINYQPQPHYCL